MKTTHRRMFVAIICAFALLASVAGVAAQQERRPAPPVIVQNEVGGGPGVYTYAGGQGDNTFVFVSSEMSFDGKLVKGAPYSAQVVTESVQTLADGNRIVRRTSAAVYRDSEGRTRREQTISAVGSFASAGEPQETIFINDPVGQVNYILDAKSRTARKVDLSALLPMKKMVEAGVKPGIKPREGGQEQQQRVENEVMKVAIEKAAAGGKMMVPPGPPMAFEHSIMTKFDAKNTKKESLGKQTIEGVEAEGTRTTITIAAGEIGNEAPINIVSETWYSPELQTVVMSKHSDPRMGENTYRLTNISRTEPARSLFEVPSDYTIKEMPGPGPRFNIERDAKRSNIDK